MSTSHAPYSAGAIVNGVPVTPESLPHPLSSQDLIQVGDKAFYFLLPASSSRGDQFARE